MTLLRLTSWWSTSTRLWKLLPQVLPSKAIEQIDIGGPTMVRAAAKNHGSVAIVTNPEAYHDILTAVANGGFSLEDRRRLAVEAFAHTASYDTAVAAWMAENFDDADHPAYTGHALELKDSLRYGENPHQPAAIYTAATAAPGIAQANLLHGKAMSFNNYVDADAAVQQLMKPTRGLGDQTRQPVDSVKPNDANDASPTHTAKRTRPIQCQHLVVLLQQTDRISGDGPTGQRHFYRGRRCSDLV